MIKGLFFDFDGVITMEKQGSPTINLVLMSLEIVWTSNAILCDRQ